MHAPVECQACGDWVGMFGFAPGLAMMVLEEMSAPFFSLALPSDIALE